ncbi:MAG: isoleucine--tRNA ligase [Chitinophagaceae bacterium]|nr:isoleucine--tRNA ligase [Chitinophagaceae bacterium]
MATKYKEYTGLNLPAIEQEILSKWIDNQTFKKSIAIREGAAPFVFYEGPPSANGMPGIHHVISRTLKDLVCRYKTMQGFQVKRKAGWDTHGLPVELGVEKMLGITKEDIGKKISVEDYNATCRREVLKYKDKWDELTRKMGYWVDLSDPYITFDNNYIETLWWCLSELYKKGLLYESVSIQPYSPAAGTGLSSHELNQPGTYKMVKDTSATVLFSLAKSPGYSRLGNEEGLSTWQNMEKYGESDFYRQLFQKTQDAWKENPVGSKSVFFMAWTTTPWTLPSNLGLAVGRNIDYVLIKTFNPYTHEPINVILAKSLVLKYFKAENENGDFNTYTSDSKNIPWKILKEFKGHDLATLYYEQLLPFEANTVAKVREFTPNANPFKVVIGDFVTTEDGTGIVHVAPAFGADDFRVGQKNNIGIVTLVDREGKFIDGVGEFSGRYVKNYKDEKDYVDVNVDICVKLKKENRAFKIEKYEHNYPHCWRTDKPVLYYPLDAWFIKTTALKNRMVELNKTINWKPKSTGEGRFGNWLENMVDWNLSRSRYWGTPLPVWRTEDGEEEICIGSIAELNAEIKKAGEILGGGVNKNYLHEGILDLHKPYVDEVILVSKTGKPMKRVPDLVDVWFDSGAMPYAQWHFPFENKEIFAQNYPADFIAEGVDQTRGWFYTLHALGSLLKESVQEELKKAGFEVSDEKYPGLAYKTCVSNGLVLDKNGNKMSKRLGNVVDPFKTIEQFGADATRWYLITNASPWDSLKFDLEGIKEVQRKFFGTLYNTYQFFALYANVDGFAFKEAYIPLANRPEIDRWILSSLNSLIKKVTDYMNDYEPTHAGRAIEDFVDEHLSNWYVRLCRRRFWKGEYGHDKICAYQTLFECLETILRLMAPLSPFFSDAVFNNLNAVSGRHNVASVHHTLFPAVNTGAIDEALEERMQLAQDISSLILSLRKKVNIKVRQPLQKVLIPVLNPGMKAQVEKIEELIKTEVNIKGIEYLTENNGFISKKIKPNFVALGKKLGPKMKLVTSALASFSQEDINTIEREGAYNLQLNGEIIPLQLSEVEIQSEDVPGWIVANKGMLTVALDVTITPELENEGNARELVNRIQKIRKDNGYELTDRILVKLSENPILKPSISEFNTYICAEILSDKLEWLQDIPDGIEIEVNDIPLKILVTKKA